MRGKRACRICYPTLQIIERVVEKLRELYPDDYIRWKGNGRERVE